MTDSSSVATLPSGAARARTLSPDTAATPAQEPAKSPNPATRSPVQVRARIWKGKHEQTVHQFKLLMTLVAHFLFNAIDNKSSRKVVCK